MSKRIAIITGITGQDASYLSELLLEKDYNIYGIKRRTSTNTMWRIQHLLNEPNFNIIEGDVTDPSSINCIIGKIKPTEIYSLAAMSHVHTSFEQPAYTFNVNANGPLYILEAVRNLSPNSRVYQASTSELFGSNYDIDKQGNKYQDEDTALKPNSPYALAKLCAHGLMSVYARAYNIFSCSGILMNHESSRRGEEFVTRKITQWIGKFKNWSRKIDNDYSMNDIEILSNKYHTDFSKLRLGNINSYRDWGHSKDFCIDLNTKILTIDGYKNRDEVNIGDKTINYNLDLDKWENDIIKKIYDIEYKGFMYVFSGNGFNFRCSENHRILYQQKSQNSKNWSKWKEITAKELYSKFNNKSIHTKYNYRFPGFNGIKQSDYNISNDMIKLIGYLVTEGCLCKSKNIGGGLQLSVSQSIKNQKYLDELIQCMNNLKLTYHTRSREDGVQEFTFNSESRDIILDYFDGFDIHILPSFIYKFSYEQAYLLYETMMNCDGCWSAMSYISKKFILAEQFSDIANYAGFRTKIHKRKNDNVYCVIVFSHAKKSVYQYITDITQEYVEENIWCVETENNKTIITKGNIGKFISGNCRAMWMMLQRDKPETFVIATGKAYTVAQFCESAFTQIGVTNWRDYIYIDPELYRPCEVEYLCGRPNKAKLVLGWEPKITFEELVKEMVQADIERESK